MCASNKNYKRHIASSRLKCVQKNMCIFEIVLSKQQSFVRVDDHLDPLPPKFQPPTDFFFRTQHCDDDPLKSKIIYGVWEKCIMGISCSPCHPKTVAKNQRCHSLEIIFSYHRQKRAFLTEDGTDMLLFLPLSYQTQQWNMGKG